MSLLKNIGKYHGNMAIAFAAVWFAFIGFVISSCSSSEPPPPPSTTTTTTYSDGESDSSGFGNDEFANDDNDDTSDNSLDDDGDDDSSSSGGYERGGAEVGEEDLQAEVKECLAEGQFFDRFSSDEGKCTRRDLANLDCTEDGIMEYLSTKQKSQFENALEADYDGYVIDQCADCPPGTSSDICKKGGSGDSQEGTKVFFVQELDSELLGKAMLLPIRPNQDGTAATDDEE